jgi:hypothetical protein
MMPNPLSLGQRIQTETESVSGALESSLETSDYHGAQR